MKFNKQIFLIILIIISISFVFAQEIDWASELGFKTGDVIVEEGKLIEPVGVKIKVGGYIDYLHGDETKKREYKNLKKDSKIYFKDGKLVEVDIVVGGGDDSTTKYKFGNYEYELPKGTKVILKNKELRIKLPDEESIKLEAIKNPVDKDYLDVKFVVDNENSNKGINIKENYFFNKIKSEDEGLLNFDTKLGEFYVTKAVIDNLKIGAWPNQDYKTYVLFDEDAIKEVGKEWPFIYIGNKEKFIMGSPKGKMSASVELIDGSIGGIEKEDNDRFIIQALYGKNLIKIEDKGTEEIPVIEAKGEYAVISSNKLYYYWKENERPLIGISKREDLTSPDFHLISLDSEGKGLKHTYNIKGKDVEVDIVDLFVFEDKFYASSKKEGKEVMKKVVFGQLNNLQRDKLSTLMKHSEDNQKRLLDESVSSLLGKSIGEIKGKLDSIDEKQLRSVGSSSSGNGGGSSQGGSSNYDYTKLDAKVQELRGTDLGKYLSDLDVKTLRHKNGKYDPLKHEIVVVGEGAGDICPNCVEFKNINNKRADVYYEYHSDFFIIPMIIQGTVHLPKVFIFKDGKLRWESTGAWTKGRIPETIEEEIKKLL